MAPNCFFCPVLHHLPGLRTLLCAKKSPWVLRWLGAALTTAWAFPFSREKSKGGSGWAIDAMGGVQGHPGMVYLRPCEEGAAGCAVLPPAPWSKPCAAGCCGGGRRALLWQRGGSAADAGDARAWPPAPRRLDTPKATRVLVPWPTQTHSHGTRPRCWGKDSPAPTAPAVPRACADDARQGFAFTSFCLLPPGCWGRGLGWQDRAPRCPPVCQGLGLVTLGKCHATAPSLL